MRHKNKPNLISDYISKITDPTYVSPMFELNNRPIPRAVVRTSNNSR